MNRPIHVAFVFLTISLAACTASTTYTGETDDEDAYSSATISAGFVDDFEASDSSGSMSSASVDPLMLTGATMSVESSVANGEAL